MFALLATGSLPELLPRRDSDALSLFRRLFSDQWRLIPVVSIDRCAAVHGACRPGNWSSRLVFSVSNGVLFVGSHLITRFRKCRIISLLVTWSAWNIIMFVTIVALLMCYFEMSVARRALKLG